ncbi:MAG: rhodanese-like domain-containing protein [Desulfonatronovibrionaceae bacterium]
MDKDRPMIVSCRTQNRDRAAYEELSKMGSLNIYVLQGGLKVYIRDRQANNGQ